MRLFAAILLLSLTTRSYQDNVDFVEACSKVDAVYEFGASQYIAELLHKSKPYAPAQDYIKGASIGNGSGYHDVKAGDVVGFPGHLHWLAIYIGYADCPCMFMDVPYDGANVRCWRNDYGPDEMFQYSYPTHTYQNSTDGPVSTGRTTAGQPLTTGSVTGRVSTGNPPSAGPTTQHYSGTTERAPTARGNSTYVPSNSTDWPHHNTTGGSVAPSNITAQTPPFDQNSTAIAGSSTLFPVTGQSNASEAVVTANGTFVPSVPTQVASSATVPSVSTDHTTGNTTAAAPGSGQYHEPLRHLVAFAIAATVAARYYIGSSFL